MFLARAASMLTAISLAGCAATTVEVGGVASASELVVKPSRTPARVQVINQGPGGISLRTEGPDSASDWKDTLGTGAIDCTVPAGSVLIITASNPGPEPPLLRLVIDNTEGFTLEHRPVPETPAQR